MTLLDRFLEPVVVRGLVQVAAASALAAVVLGLSYLRSLDLESELGWAFVRGFVQVIAMGAFIGVLFSVPLAWSGGVLLAMMAIAAWISKDRGGGVPGVLRVSFVAVLFGSGLVIVAMLAAGAIDATVRNLIPVGGMIIANAMKTNSLALDRFKGEVRSNRAEIEAVLALGVPPEKVISEYVTTSVRASLIPMVDSLKSLGLVYIPGMMSGMILAGANPIYAAEYQFVIMGMLFAAGGLTSMASTLLVGKYAFTEAEQLKPFEEPTDGGIRTLLNRG
ncbi:ABC transporter permease [Halopelagius longus]|uniref:Iron export ABC transporter permease subunit FetB n=1 Tax=Halopelagius longus TaxID=1236180 RepID=A0A1H0YQ20_9EURY|nr:iron export ABC transporter permease subunit FetB [Halopelagius longus]RDI72614.1 iron export ABC transporter permease subunit FetB [Halopelagius longus]SDQ17220.1 putative ABC transport system permease protein [Halopelagius longus]